MLFRNLQEKFIIYKRQSSPVYRDQSLWYNDECKFPLYYIPSV